MKIAPLLPSVLLIALLSACSTSEKTIHNESVLAEPEPILNDYPTQERVEYVLNCIAQHGGLTYLTKYACSCKIDKIAEKLTHKEYEEARTFAFLRGTPGENGGIFRDPTQSKDLRTRLKEAEDYAEKSCFVK